MDKLRWYKYARCYMEWNREESDFGKKMACLMLMNQLIEYTGNKVDETIVNTRQITDNFYCYWPDANLCEEAVKMLQMYEFDVCLELLLPVVSELCSVMPNTASVKEITEWCEAVYMAYNRISENGCKVVPFVQCACRYLMSDDLDVVESVSDLVSMLSFRIYGREE